MAGRAKRSRAVTSTVLTGRAIASIVDSNRGEQRRVELDAAMLWDEAHRHVEVLARRRRGSDAVVDVAGPGAASLAPRA